MNTSASSSYIPRSRYLSRITPYIGKNIIKVLVGQRRVGKSVLLVQLINKIEAEQPDTNVIYINKELAEFDNLNDYKKLNAYLSKHIIPGKKNAVFIDEIQDISEFEKSLRSLQAKGGCDIYITGSNAFLLSGELATYLSGRYIEFKIFGLTYGEFLHFHQRQDSDQAFLDYLKFGGLPYLINLDLQEEIVFEYLRNIYTAILFKDVMARHQIRQVSLLETLVKYLADNVGNIVSAKNIADFLKSQKIKTTANIILDYLYYLEEAFFVNRVSRADLKGKKILEVGHKFYFEDLGLRHALIGYRTADISKILENIVHLHLCAAGYKVYVGKWLNQEIDFVCERLNQRMYVQVAYLLNDEKTIAREFGNLEKIKDNFPKYVVTMDPMAQGNRNGIEHACIRKFLTDLVP